MSDVHNLKEFSFAKQMLIDIPMAILALENAYAQLDAHKNFNAVAKVNHMINGAIVNLQSNLPYFEKIVNNKGGSVD